MMEDIGSAEEQWDNTPPQTVKEKRGNFLTTVSTLSWVSQAMTASSALMMLVRGRGSLEEQVGLMNKLTETEMSGIAFFDNMIIDSISLLEITIMNFTQINLTNLLVVMTGALGVLMMFKLKKIGFFIYLIYCCSEIYAAYYFFGDLRVMMMSIAFSGLISVVFIILYAVNLKRMTE